MITRRTLTAAGAATFAVPAKAADRVLPDGFLWGTAISAYQSEGGNINTDTWLLEGLTPTVYKDRSGDACDSYHRYKEDIALNAALGFNCYRFGIEWARIEPVEGTFSEAELDHYVRVLETCHARNQVPIVTYNHFSVPRWFAERGGWERADAPDLFARYCAKATGRLGDLIGRATTFNEANVQLLVQLFGKPPQRLALEQAMLAAARKATGSDRFSSLAYADPRISQPILLAAHRQGYLAMKAARPDLPVGISLTTQEIDAESDPALARTMEERLYGGWADVARTHADFVGVQTYTRLRFGRNGLLPPPEGAELTAAGYEFYPQALGPTIRWAHRTIGKPIYVTESGYGGDDDRRRIAYIDQALESLASCLRDGVPVHSYVYWSLLDNFEWASGYDKHFGLVAVDRTNFKRTPKPSAFHLGERAKRNLILAV